MADSVQTQPVDTDPHRPMTNEEHTLAMVLGVSVVRGHMAGFWSSLTPAQALALLKAAPKVAQPWETDAAHTHDSHVVTVVRRHPLTGIAVWVSEFFHPPTDAAHRFYWSLPSDERSKDADSMDAARAAADAALLAHGWVLL